MESNLTEELVMNPRILLKNVTLYNDPPKIRTTVRLVALYFFRSLTIIKALLTMAMKTDMKGIFCLFGINILKYKLGI
eukprot:snap_masked-scaffold_4-processed-gene-0.28-mRNA-1 protein AED:1.00 eAED:1.00 QI:0/0/0/0/1/1/2/0/77